MEPVKESEFMALVLAKFPRAEIIEELDGNVIISLCAEERVIKGENGCEVYLQPMSHKR